MNQSLRIQWLSAALTLASLGASQAASLTLSGFTGTPESLTAGELNAFAPDSDTGGYGDVLSITASSTPATGGGTNPTNTNTAVQYIDSGFAFDALLTLDPGEVLDTANSFIDLVPGAFDDGFLVQINDITVLSFNQFDWQSNDIGTIFGGGWQPWTNEGNSTLRVGDGTIQLLSTATSNGSGALAGVSSGDTIDILPFLDAVSGNFTYNPTPGLDLLSGYSFEVYTTNHSGPWSISQANLSLTASVIPEPSRALLIGVGLFSLIRRRRRL